MRGAHPSGGSPRLALAVERGLASRARPAGAVALGPWIQPSPLAGAGCGLGPSHAGTDLEGHEVAAQAVGRARDTIGVEEQPHEFRARAQDFASPRIALAIVLGGPVEELERALERGIEALRLAALARPQGAFDLAAHLRELLADVHGQPALSGELGMVAGHDLSTSSSTTAQITSRKVGSSTPRERFPRDDRTLIIESCSNQSSPGSAG